MLAVRLGYLWPACAEALTGHGLGPDLPRPSIVSWPVCQNQTSGFAIWPGSGTIKHHICILIKQARAHSKLLGARQSMQGGPEFQGHGKESFKRLKKSCISKVRFRTHPSGV